MLVQYQADENLQAGKANAKELHDLRQETKGQLSDETSKKKRAEDRCAELETRVKKSNAEFEDLKTKTDAVSSITVSDPESVLVSEQFFNVTWH